MKGYQGKTLALGSSLCFCLASFASWALFASAMDEYALESGSCEGGDPQKSDHRHQSSTHVSWHAAIIPLFSPNESASGP